MDPAVMASACNYFLTMCEQAANALVRPHLVHVLGCGCLLP